MKNFRILLILLIIAVIVSVSGVTALAVYSADVNANFDFYDAEISNELLGQPEESVNKAEVIYNDLILKSGAIMRSLMFSVNSEVLTAGMGESEALKTEESAKANIAYLKQLFTEKNFTVDGDDYFLEVGLEYYDSYTDLYIAYDMDGYMTSEPSKADSKGAFFNLYQSTRYTVFNNIENTYIQLGMNTLRNIENITDDEIRCVYNYGTKYSTGCINSNADKIYKDSSLKINIHRFELSLDNLNRTYTLYQTTPNTTVWYLTAILISLIPAAAFMALAMKQKTKRSDTNE